MVPTSVNHMIRISGLYHASTQDRNEKNWPRWPADSAALPKQTNPLESRGLLKKLLQAAQKDSEARRAMIDERRRTVLVR